jgi:hypothetical protein
MANTIPGPDKSVYEFWQELGRFISYYSAVEMYLNLVVRKFYGMRLDIANLVLGQLRPDAALDHLNKLRNAKMIEDGDWIELKQIKGQIGEITKLRNDIVHLGVSYTVPAGYVISNEIWSYVDSKTRLTLVNNKILDDATIDLFKIFNRLVILLRPGEREFREKESGDLLREAWRYKPLSLRSPYPTPRSNRPKRKSRRAPFPP